jgi:hypothetical protein
MRRASFLLVVASLATVVGCQTLAVGNRVTSLTRETQWRQVEAVPLAFETHHPQGLVKIGDEFILSSVEVRTRPKRLETETPFDRDAGEGVGHLFRFDAKGQRLADLHVGEGAMYHPGGIDYDGTHVWVSVAEYRPNSRSIIYRVDPKTMTAVEVLRVADHLGAIVRNTDDNTLHAVSWGSRRFYRWTLDKSGAVTNANEPLQRLRTLNPSHYIDYQDCKYAGGRRMLCTGVAEIRRGPDVAMRLGGVELVNLADSRPIHQAPVLLWTPAGLPMTQNPAWIESVGIGVRAYFVPEDAKSTLYIYEGRRRLEP